jgi:enoyl-CoA hydratase/carnithine racemase
LDKSRLNALSNELISAIMNALDGIELDHAIRSIVVTGTGRAFSSGADIAAFQRHMETGPAEAGETFSFRSLIFNHLQL